MTRSRDRERQRRRELDLGALRDSIELGSRVHGTDRTIRRLVRLGWVENPDYAYGAARNATADITEAGRAVVE